jgi:hypothetical protein
MTTLSVRDVARSCFGMTGEIAVNSDLYGYIHRDTDGSLFGALEPDRDILPWSGTAETPTARSLRRHLETVSGPAVDLVMILVGHEDDFSGAVSLDDVTKVQYALQVARDLYAQVDFGIRSVVWWRIPMANVDGHVDIDGDHEAKALTHAHSGPPGGVDVFLVQTLSGAAGVAPAPPSGAVQQGPELPDDGRPRCAVLGSAMGRHDARSRGRSLPRLGSHDDEHESHVR